MAKMDFRWVRKVCKNNISIGGFRGRSVLNFESKSIESTSKIITKIVIKSWRRQKILGNNRNADN